MEGRKEGGGKRARRSTNRRGTEKEGSHCASL